MSSTMAVSIGKTRFGWDGAIKSNFMILTAIHGFCMALADSVPGVSGGTIAFILGFYDRFLDALHSLFGKDNAARRAAIVYLLELGAGWV